MISLPEHAREYPRRISPQALRKHGWTRQDGWPWPRYFHRDGWALTHCGHPTAHFPWELWAPDGRRILTGADGPQANPEFGRAWATVAWAVQFVALKGALFA